MMTQLLAAVIVSSLALYVVSGGADYGAGVWDLLSGGPFKEEQKELIANAIRPIWEANHIWLILILVLLFSGFPRAFSSIMVALFIPILLVLLGIILRGSSRLHRLDNAGQNTFMARFFRTQERNTHLQLIENYATRWNRASSLTDQKSVVLIRLQIIENTRQQMVAIFSRASLRIRVERQSSC
jgi:hypothetical protein